LATRRKYKVPHFRDGGRVMEDVPIEGDAPNLSAPNLSETEGFPAEILGDAPSPFLDLPATGVTETPVAEPPPAEAKPSANAISDDNPLQRALDAQRRAEELQRQAPQRPPPSSAIEQRIDSLPGLSEHKRAFLKQFPVILEDQVVGQTFNRHYQEGLKSGLADDSPELDQYLIANTVREIEHRRQLALASESVDEAVQKLDDEIEANRRSEEPPAPPSPRPAPRRSVPMSAPVSREAPMWSGQRGTNENNTLRADEREIARVSFPHLPAAQAEYEYLKNKRLMIQRKASGEIQGDR
jgi:hypothetical protein